MSEINRVRETTGELIAMAFGAWMYSRDGWSSVAACAIGWVVAACFLAWRDRRPTAKAEW